jgi:hypothetical protein
MFRHFKMPSSGIQILTCWDGGQWCGKQRRMGAVYCDRWCNGRDVTGWSVPSPSNMYALCHNIQLPSFSAYHNIWHHLSMFISDSLLMAFQNRETCGRMSSTNTLNEWRICWSFTDLKKMHGPKCKIILGSYLRASKNNIYMCVCPTWCHLTLCRPLRTKA